MKRDDVAPKFEFIPAARFVGQEFGNSIEHVEIGRSVEGLKWSRSGEFKFRASKQLPELKQNASALPRCTA
jgi:hypothetical protein